MEHRRFRVFGERVRVPTPKKLGHRPSLLDPLAMGRKTVAVMKAGVYTEAGTLELQDWPEPAAGPGELLVRVRGCGLCGSDISEGDEPGHEGPCRLRPRGGGGHRPGGRGRARGSARGQRIVAAHHVPCFACHYCRRGSASMCRHFKRINLDPGGFAELCRVPAPNVDHATFALPEAMSDESASFTEPLACCLRAVKRCRVERGDTVIVVGLGSIGCLLIQAFTLSGTTVFGSDLMPVRRALGRGAGARVFDSDAELDRALDEATDGRGADVVMLTAGGAALLPWAAAHARDGGHLHYFAGGSGESLPLALAELYHRELTLSTTYSSSPVELREAFDLLSQGKVTVDGLITHRLPLAKLAHAVELMQKQEAVKVYITP